MPRDRARLSSPLSVNPPDLERTTLQAVSRRLLPFLFVLYVISFLDRRMTILSERAFPEATAFPVPDLPEADLTGLMPSTTAGVASRRSCRQETEKGLDRNYPLI